MNELQTIYETLSYTNQFVFNLVVGVAIAFIVVVIGDWVRSIF